MISSFELGATLLHEFLGSRESFGWVFPIGIRAGVAAPEFWLYLVSGDFAGGADGVIIVPSLDLRECGPTIHRVDFKRDLEAECNCSDEQA